MVDIGYLYHRVFTASGIYMSINNRRRKNFHYIRRQKETSLNHQEKMATTPPPTSLLLKIHQQKAMDQKKAYDASKKQDLVYSLMAESLKQNVALKKPRSAKKLKFDDDMPPPPPPPPSSPTPALTDTSLEEQDRGIICYCNDLAKECTAKSGKEFYCCPHSRYVVATKKYESDCDFFLFKDNISKNLCHCGYGMRQFPSKDKVYMNEACIYKNAPTVWKKMNSYSCDMMTRKKLDEMSELC